MSDGAPVSAWAAGLQLRCPSCGKGPVFSGYLKFHERCAVCAADLCAADAGDGPAVFVILFVGAVAAPLLIILQFGLNLAAWLAMTITGAVAFALCLALLPYFKSVLFAFQWKHKAREATGRDVR